MSAVLGLQIDVILCHLDGRVYVRKSIEKRLALRNRDVSLLLSILYICFVLAPEIRTLIFAPNCSYCQLGHRKFARG
jgi:hypothetical protein